MAGSSKDLLIEIRTDDNGSAKVVRDNTAAIEGLSQAEQPASQSIDRLSRKQKGMKLSTAQANRALMDTGRIIQDLPYGIRGVANNLDPFIESMQRAKQQTGSWGSVLGGLGKSLLGPAGIAIGISALTSIMISMGPQILKFFGIFDKGKEKIKRIKEQSEEFVEAIKDMNEELAELRGFDSSSILDTDATREALQRFNIFETELRNRVDALNKLENDAAFIRLVRTGDIEKQKGYTEEFITWVQEQFTALEKREAQGITYYSLSEEQQAALEQFKSDLEAVNKQIDELNDKRSLSDRLSILPSFDRMQVERRQLQAEQFIQEQRTELAENTANEIEAVELELAQKKAEIRANDNLNEKQQDKLILDWENYYSGQIINIKKAQKEEQAALAAAAAAEQKAIEQARLEAFLRSQQLAMESMERAQAQMLENLRQKAVESALALEELLEIEIDFELDPPPTPNWTKYMGATQAQRRALMRYNKELATSRSLTEDLARKQLLAYRSGEKLSKGIEELAEGSLVTLGETIGQALAGDLEGNPFDKFKLLIADFMSFYGKALIALGIGSKAFQKFLSNPVVAIIAGTALVALAAAIRSTAQDRVDEITAGGGSERVTSYRGLDFGEGQANNTNNGQSNAGPVSGALERENASEKESREITIKDGFGNIVARGQEEIDRRGGSNYLRGE